MSVRTELIALGVRIVADKTNLIRKPTAFEAAIDTMFDGETYDQRIARNIESELVRAVNTTARLITSYQTKKSTQIN